MGTYDSTWVQLSEVFDASDIYWAQWESYQNFEDLSRFQQMLSA